MSNYETLYKDIFDDPKNYSFRKYDANGMFIRNPVFIGGSGRSGTTIIAKAISLHPEVLNFVEVRFLLSLKRNINITDKMYPFYKNDEIYNKITKGLRVAGYRDADKIYSKKVLEDICLNDVSTATKRFFEIGLKAWNKSVIVEKTPHTFLIANKLRKIFPNIRYIHVFRDPRDIFSSVKLLPWGPSNVYSFITWYNDLMSAAYRVKREVSYKNYLLVKLEDLAENPEEELKRIFKFTNLDFQTDYCKIITRRGAHVSRYINDLNEDEIDILWKGCKNIYIKWKKLYNKERKNKI